MMHSPTLLLFTLSDRQEDIQNAINMRVSDQVVSVPSPHFMASFV